MPQKLPIILLAAAFIFFNTTLWAQLPGRGNPARVLAFKTAQDSIHYHAIGLQVQEEQQSKKPRQPLIDSLATIQQRMIDTGAARFVIVYRPGRGYTNFATMGDTVTADDVTELSVDGVDRIPRSIVRFKNLHTLELVNSTVQKLPRWLRKLDKLRTVEIFNNKPARRLHLAKLRDVSDLALNGCDARTLPRSYRKFTGLKLLDISANNLSSLPRDLYRNKKLKELNAQYNQLTLTETLTGHPTIERLSLQHNEITHVPASISNFPELIRLSLNYNRISTVDPAITKLKKLQYASFYVNSLKEIPKPLYKISSLKVIDLFYNEIEELDSTLNDWSGLEVLYLAHNKLVVLPPNLDDLKSLRGLYLDHNRIDRLPESVGSIDSLQVLKVNHNFLREIPTTVLNLTELQELDISNNYISDISPALFDFKKYKIFSLANNPWSPETKKMLTGKVRELRGRDVFVHVLGELDH